MGEVADGGGRSDRQVAEEFTIPTQLRQAFIEVPSKDRLMALVGLLRQVKAGCCRLFPLTVWYTLAMGCTFPGKDFPQGRF